MSPSAMSYRAHQGLQKRIVHHPHGFTLVEMMVAATLLIIIIGIVLRMTNQTAKVWKDSNSKIQSFQEARAGFEAMTRTLGQATLNTYYDYYNAAKQSRLQLTGTALTNFSPATYDRVSDLHFVSGQATTLLNGSNPPIITQTQAVFFQAPMGYSVIYPKLNTALNACGYFLQFSDAASVVPDYYKTSSAYKPRWRFRLMEMIQSTEQLSIYGGNPAPPVNDWFLKNAGPNSRIMAENVIALVILPKLSDRDDDPGNASGRGVTLAPNYNYNSRVALGATADSDWSGASPAFPPDSFTAYPAKGGNITMTRHHQLPPLLQIVMIVIDEPSAQRLQGNSTGVPSAINLANVNPPLFTDASKLAEDIQKVEDICNAKAGNLTNNTTPLVYRVFSSDILMREAKWSNR